MEKSKRNILQVSVYTFFKDIGGQWERKLPFTYSFYWKIHWKYLKYNFFL